MIQKRIMKKDFKEDCEEGKVVIQAIEKDLIDADVTVDIAEGVVGVVVVVVVVIGEVAVWALISRVLIKYLEKEESTSCS